MYEFKGRHYLASLYGVKKIKNHELLKEVFTKAIEQSNETICGYTEHIFSDGGMTGIFLLKKSHCSFHTYAEQKNMFVDFFTCGTGSDWRVFENILLCNLEMDKSKSQRIHRT